MQRDPTLSDPGRVSVHFVPRCGELLFVWTIRRDRGPAAAALVSGVTEHYFMTQFVSPLSELVRNDTK